jgi:hypothetical protein
MTAGNFTEVREFMGKTAVITGATSGFGAAFARRLAQDGYNLVITGRKKEIIQKLADEITGKNKVKVDLIIAELSNDTDIQRVLEYIKKKDDVEILINNAGQSGYDQHFEDVNIIEHEKLVKVQNIVPMRLISLVLPGMIKRHNGAIINVASMASFLPMPGFSVYCGVKGFLRLYTESLHFELMDKGIKVQALCPGYSDTNWGKEYFSERLTEGLSKSKGFPPEKVVDASLKALKKNKWVCIPGMSNKMMTNMFTALPLGMYASLLNRMTPFR